VTEALSQEELEAEDCWEPGDHVPGRPQMTEFRRRLRLHQSRWRASKGHPKGTQPIVPPKGKPSRPVGSRLPLDYAQETGANFLAPGALDAVRARMSIVEPSQSLDRQRIWADLLWSPSVAFNLFGDLAGDLRRADHAVHVWWPDAPGTVSQVLFAHSPGWLDPTYLNSLRAFDAAFELDVDDGTRAIVGIDVEYHEWLKPETPKPSNLPRYLDVARRSRAFRRGAVDAVKGRGGLAVMWLEHLLLLSMLQRPGGKWSWGRYVVVHPEGNSDYAEACTRYRGMLSDPSTFSSTTLEELLSGRALPAKTVTALRERYVPAGAPGRPRS
jgi:PD-(D/E)XK nuclease superfamily protein